MNCWHCKTKLIWGGDHETEEDVWSMETSLSCPQCFSFVSVLLPKNIKDFQTKTLTNKGENDD